MDLNILVKWCEGGVMINVEKSGIMHMRKKTVGRCEVAYDVDGEVIPMVSRYKYLGCVNDEHLEFKEMVEEKVAAGRRVLAAWLNKCRVEVGKGCWKRCIAKCVSKFGWQDVSGGMIRELLQTEVNGMLPSVALRNAFSIDRYYMSM